MIDLTPGKHLWNINHGMWNNYILNYKSKITHLQNTWSWVGFLNIYIYAYVLSKNKQTQFFVSIINPDYLKSFLCYELNKFFLLVYIILFHFLIIYIYLLYLYDNLKSTD